jgi:hypothetical protein
MRKSTKLFPVQKALLQWHLTKRSGYPTDDAVNWPVDPALKKATTTLYTKWLAKNLDVEPETMERFLNGTRNVKTTEINILLSALGQDNSSLPLALRRQAQWELEVALGVVAEPAMYSARLDAVRARVGIEPRFVNALPRGSLPDMPAEGIVVPATGRVSMFIAGATDGLAAQQPERQRQFESTLNAMDHPLCLQLVRAIARQCRSPLANEGATVTGDGILGMIQAFRGLAARDRAEPVDALTRAILDFKERNRRDPEPPALECHKAAKALFSLLLMDYAVATRAQLMSGDAPFVYAGDTELLGAALVLDDAVGNDVQFVRITETAAVVGTASAIAIQVDGLLTEAHQTGVLPAGEKFELRRDIARRLLVAIEDIDQTGHGVAASDQLPTNKEQRDILSTLARQRNQPLRLSVDLAHPDAQHRLGHAERLADEIGIPVVVFGANPGNLTERAACGEIHSDVRSLHVLVGSFLKALKELEQRPTA